ncbi:IS4 family transposase [Bdellovibrionota bacterium FG-1]
MKKESGRWIRFLLAMKQHFADASYGYLWKTLETTASALQQFELDVISPKSGEKRTALIEVRFAEIEVCPPIRAMLSKQRRDGGSKWSPLKTNAILAREVGTPGSDEALEWMLLTRLPVNALEDALEKIRWYRLRWHIEEFHKVLKSGCRAEDCRLSSATKLTRYLTLVSVIAIRLYWITHLNRHKPDSPCNVVLEEHEWKALHLKMTGSKTVPTLPPTLRQATRWIAQLGGFLARKGDGEPGIVTLWRGWQRLQDIADAWLLFNRHAATCG